jgi:DNA transposition AAA+ family ATPase
MISKKDITKVIEKLKVFDDKFRDAIGTMLYGFHRCKKLRISSIAAVLPGNYESNAKSISRTLDKLEVDELQEGLLSFVKGNTKYLLMDLTEMVRKDAEHMDYVGYLKDGKTRGYNVFIDKYTVYGSLQSYICNDNFFGNHK